MRTSVVLADGDSFELLALGSALRLHGVTVIGEAKSNQLAESLVEKLAPDVALIDISRNGPDGIELCNKLRKSKPDIGIVIITDCPDLRLLGVDQKSFPIGAQVILKKSVANFTSICSAIEYSITAVLEREEMKWAIENTSIPKKARESIVKELTDSQVEILRLVVEGCSNAEIGRIRFVSEKAVEQMVARIAQQLSISYDRKMNLRARLVSEYYKSIGAGEK